MRGLKLYRQHPAYYIGCRTFTGAWIETTRLTTFAHVSGVAPSRVRGLKHLTLVFKEGTERRTFTGAWIETVLR